MKIAERVREGYPPKFPKLPLSTNYICGSMVIITNIVFVMMTYDDSVIFGAGVLHTSRGCKICPCLELQRESVLQTSYMTERSHADSSRSCRRFSTKQRRSWQKQERLIARSVELETCAAILQAWFCLSLLSCSLPYTLPGTSLLRFATGASGVSCDS